MRIVVVLALAALVALVVALVTGSTVPAVAVIVLAGAGVVLLLRDWRTERPVMDDSEHEQPHAALSADELSPDISGDPGGPSSDARSDQS